MQWFPSDSVAERQSHEPETDPGCQAFEHEGLHSAVGERRGFRLTWGICRGFSKRIRLGLQLGSTQNGVLLKCVVAFWKLAMEVE